MSAMVATQLTITPHTGYFTAERSVGLYLQDAFRCSCSLQSSSLRCVRPETITNRMHKVRRTAKTAR